MARSHYIPQFILRHFCVDNKIMYCDLDNQKIESRNTKSAFSEKDYYPDELEKALCEKIEAQFANLLNNKILTSRHKLTLTADELLLVKKYLLITVFRFKNEDPVDKGVFADFIGEEIAEYEGNFYENLIKILNCQTHDEIFDYADFDNEKSNPKLTAYVRDILYSYLVFVSSKYGEEDFLIPDKGYASYEGPGKNKKFNAMLNLAKLRNDPQLLKVALTLTPHDYSVFPISRSMSIINMSTFYKYCTDDSPFMIKYPEEAPSLKKMLGFGNKEIIKQPKTSNPNGKVKEYTYTINPIRDDDVGFLSSLLLENADHFIACADLERIQGTVELISDNKNFSFLVTN